MPDVFNVLDRIASSDGFRPTAALAHSIPRSSNMGSLSPLTSGRETLQLIWLEAGTLVSNITWVSWTQAAVTPTNQWFSLRSAARALLGITADATTAAWGASTAKTLALASPYTVPTTGHYYVGLMVAAGTVPSIIGSGGSGVISALPPITCGSDATNTGLTTPASAPATSAALTAFSGVLYTYVS